MGKRREMTNAAEIEVLKACPVCGSTQSIRLARPRLVIGEAHFKNVLPEIGLVRCTACGLEYVNPRPAQALLQGFYEQPGYPPHDADHNEAFRSAPLEIVNSFAKGKRLLDFGCGGGSFLAMARSAGYVVAGVEPASVARAQVARMGIEIHPDTSALVRNGRLFDVITLWHVLDHLPNPEDVLRGLTAMMDNDAILAAAVPNLKSARCRLLTAFPSWAPSDDQRYRAFPIHLQAFSPHTQARLMKRTGFRVCKTTTRCIAIDELLRSQKPAGERAETPDQEQGAAKVSRANPLKRGLKNLIKKVFFGLCLGESLIVISTRDDGSGR